MLWMTRHVYDCSCAVSFWTSRVYQHDRPCPGDIPPYVVYVTGFQIDHCIGR